MNARFTPLAEADLAEILDHVARTSGPRRAEALLDDVVAAILALERMPRMGHRRPDLTDDDVLVWPVSGLLVAYRPEVRPMEVVRVVHGARDPEGFGGGLGADRGDDSPSSR